jgi:hypothetical protein
VARRAANHAAERSIADAALGNLLAQPHDERTARGERQHRHQDEPRPGRSTEVN